eukprot:scpid109680/ scgid1181/ 
MTCMHTSFVHTHRHTRMRIFSLARSVMMLVFPFAWRECFGLESCSFDLNVLSWLELVPGWGLGSLRSCECNCNLRPRLHYVDQILSTLSVIVGKRKTTTHVLKLLYLTVLFHSGSL